jgi:tetratricopeptide (TPR) repeat protein
MVVKTASMLVWMGVCLLVSNRPAVCREMGATDFDSVCDRARQCLREGRWDDAMAAMTMVENEARARVERDPGKELSVLMIKARAHWHQGNTEGLERFLTQFEKSYARTSAAPWVQRAAWYERMLGYRFAENLPQAAQAFEKYRELEEQWTSSHPEGNELDAVARDFDLHVAMPAQIGDLYRYMGRMAAAVERYRSALAYATAHAESFRPLDERPQQLLGSPLTPSKYREEILPTAIRECEAPQDTVIATLSRDAVCEVQQADWFLSIAQGWRQPKALDCARIHYRKARQTLEANQEAINALSSGDKARYLSLQERIASNGDSFNTELARLSNDGL